MADETMETLWHYCKTLQLPQMREALEREVETAVKMNLGYQQFLLRLLEAEGLAKTDRSIATKIQMARFPRLHTLEEFDFSFQPSVQAAQVKEWAELDFIRRHENVILLGPPGVGNYGELGFMVRNGHPGVRKLG